MSKYEMAVVLSARLEDEERAAAIENVRELIARFGGTVADVADWGKKRLAYEIQKMKEGFYYFITFEGEADCPQELEQRMRILEPVIRYLIVKKDNVPEDIKDKETGKEKSEKSGEDETVNVEPSDSAADSTADTAGDTSEASEPEADFSKSGEELTQPEPEEAETATEETV